MIVKCQCCMFADISCNKVESCKYLLHRFGVLECEPEEYKKILINSKHKQELKERTKILGGIK